MNRQQLEKNINKYASELLTEKGYISPVVYLTIKYGENKKE